MAMASDADVMAWVKDYLGNPEVLTLLHNAQHDLPMLAQAGIVPARWVDTMLMANLLQNLPKGLKALAYRLCGMTMQSYSSLVDPITEARTLDYMGRVMAWKWPKPPTMRVLESRGWREKQPWSMHTVAKSIINSWAKGTIRGRAVFDRWHDNPNRHQAEAILGKLEAATLADVDFETVLHYACRDADATRRVYPILNTRIADANLQGPLDRDYSIVPMIIAMEKVGLQVDTNHMEELGESYAKRKLEVIDEIAAMFMRYIDPASHDQVRDLLFNQLGLKPKWRTKGGSLSTNQEVLETIEQDHPVVPLILKYRELDKMQGTFVGGVLSNCARHTDHRCHTRLSMIRVLTGRLAAKEPNLLAFPQPDRSPEGKPLRDGFTTDADKVYLSGDYSQIELRVLAHMSQEPTMMEVFHSGGDIHRETAAVVFKVTPAQVTSEQRYAVKTVNFGIPYGITAPGLFRFLGAKGYTKKDCSRLIDDWFNRFDKVAAYMESVRAFARRHGYVADMFGRRRLIPEVRSAHEFVREAGLRQACNLPIQSGAGGIIKEAMGQLVPFYELLQRQDLYTWPLLQIHDDLLWETLRSILPWAVPVIKEVMESCVTLSVPVIVDFKVGNTWGTMEKYGSVTTTIGS
jgi:DNA polymerase-1